MIVLQEVAVRIEEKSDIKHHASKRWYPGSLHPVLSTTLQSSEFLQSKRRFSICFLTWLIRNNVNFRLKMDNPGRLGVFSRGWLNNYKRIPVPREANKSLCAQRWTA